MNLMVFEGKQVEVFKFEGKVLFNPKDVANCLDIRNINDNLSKMNEKQVIKLTNSKIGSADFRKVHNTGENFLTESGVYKLIFKSRKEEAERFQDWIADEVLPAIRETGGYIKTTEEDTDEMIMAKALMIGQKTIERQKQLLEEKESIIAEQNLFLDKVSASTDCILVRDVAHLLTKQGIKIGEKRLWEKLRELKLIQKGTTKPYQRALEQGLFQVNEYAIQTNHGVKLKTTTKVTGKGQVHIIKKVMEQVS
ncbi:MAG: phage antirepressor [Sarcina sp.]